MNSANQIAGEAFRAFERWCRDHDPDGELDILEAAAAYSTWADMNSIVPYLDSRSPLNQAQRSS